MSRIVIDLPTRRAIRRGMLVLLIRSVSVAGGFDAVAADAQSRPDQNDVPQTSASVPAGGANDIVVTATRRPEYLQDVPASLIALSSDQVVRTGVTSLDDVADQIPGFTISKLGDLRPRLYVRGVGTREYDPGSESSVGVFVDDMYVPRIGGVLGSLQDIERIEILKGPQSTLYGRNTIGGAINIVTKAPTPEPSVEARLAVESFGGREAFGAVSGPIAGDRLLGRLMIFGDRSDGFMTNLSDGSHSNGRRDWGGRATLQYRPTTALTVTLIDDLLRTDGSSVDAKSVGSPTDPGGTFFSGSTLGLAGSPRPIQVADRFADYYNRDSKLRRKTNSLIGKVDYDFGEGSLTSLTTYRNNSFFETRDFDATSLDAVAQSIDETADQFTAELRFTSSRDGALSMGSKLRWIVGVYYLSDRTVRNDRFDFGHASVSAIRTGSPQTDVFTGSFRTRSWAAFGTATYDLAPKLSLTGGLRFTSDRKQLVQTDAATTPGAGFITADFTTPIVRRNSDALTPNVSLSYKASADVLAYVSYNRGYKGGGFQYIPTNLGAAETTFKPETSDAYEVGIKTRFWGRRATVNVSAFYYDDRNLQVQRSTTLANGSIAIVTNNADKSTIKGIDFDAELQPVRGLSLRAAYTYLDARYDRYFNNAPGQPLTPATDFSNTPIIRSPKHSFDVSAEYAIPIAKGQSLLPRIEWTYRSEIFFEPGGGDARYGAAIPQTRQGAYGLFNASIAYQVKGLRFRVFADNLLNEFYLNDVQKLPFNYIVNYAGRPRTIGASVDAKF